MAEAGHVAEPRNFAPKNPPKLDPPKSDPISVAELAEYNGADPSKPTYVAIMGTVFNVTGNDSYAPPKGAYHGTQGQPNDESFISCYPDRYADTYAVFAGKDASRALATSSLKPEDCRPEYGDLDDKEKQVLKDWFTFFSKRYNIIGEVQG